MMPFIIVALLIIVVIAVISGAVRAQKRQEALLALAQRLLLLAYEPQLTLEKIEFNLQRLAEVRSLLPKYLFTQNA